MMNGAAVFWYFNAFQPLGKTLPHIFLKETRRTDAAMIPFHRDWPPPQVRQHHGCDRFVVSRELTLGDAVSGKQDLLGMGDHSLVRQHSRDADGAACHARST